jgi:hypothetical protein
MATLDAIEDRIVTYLRAANSTLITAANYIPKDAVASGVRFVVTPASLDRDHAPGVMGETYRFRMRGIRMIPPAGVSEDAAIEDIKTAWAAVITYFDARRSLGGLVNMARITAVDFDPFTLWVLGNQAHIFFDMYLDVVTKSAPAAQV